MASYLHARQVPNPFGPSTAPPPQEYLDENEVSGFLVSISTLYGLATLCAVLRTYVRGYKLKTFGFDDWMMTLALALSSVLFGLVVESTNYGMGRHAEYFTFVRPDHLLVFFKLGWWYAWICTITHSCIKISISAFLLRLADHRRLWRWTLIGIIVGISLFTVGFVLSLVLQCQPVSAVWDFKLRPPLGTAKCYSLEVYRIMGIFNSIFNAFTDLILAILPMPLIYNLQVTRRTRATLCLILGLGVFATATAIYKIPLQYNFFEEPDFSGKGARFFVWQQIEVSVGIMAACLPTLKPLAADFFGAVSGFASVDKYGSSGSSQAKSAKGYLRQQDETVQECYNMHEVPRTTLAPENARPAKNSYEEVIMGSGRGACDTMGNEENTLAHNNGITGTKKVQVLPV